MNNFDIVAKVLDMSVQNPHQVPSDVTLQLKIAQHFVIENELFEQAYLIATETMVQPSGQVFFDHMSRPSAPAMTIHIEEDDLVYLLYMRPTHEVDLWCISYNRTPLYMGYWKPGTNDWSAVTDGHENYSIAAMLIAVAMSLSLMNSPALVETGKSGSRQQRREMDRKRSIPVDAWHKVSWNIGAAHTLDGGSQSEGNTGVALHFRRGHLRVAEAGQAGSFATELKPTGYAIWIDGMWVGHPAYGFKKSVHTPKLHEDGLAAIKSKKGNRT